MFNTNGGGYSLSDIAAVTGSNGRSGGDGWGEGGGAWWIIILFLFVFCGWGNGGWGGNGNNGGAGSPTYQGTTTREEIAYAFDMNGLADSTRAIQQGLCDGFYAMNTGLLTQTNGINSAVCNLGYQTQQGFNDMGMAMLNNNNSQTIAMMQNQNALQTQLAQCCCDNRAGQKDIEYQMATNTCSINTNNANNTRDIIDSQNAGTRAILEAIQQGKIDAMQDKIAALTAQNTQLSFAASQAAQNNYLVEQLRPCPVPAYITCNPWGGQVAYGSCSSCNC
ncbi:MAG: hypothetical protein NC218_09375 [Acetobacter sp.]|nr:hypothetical protein [Acetobacter sp.]